MALKSERRIIIANSLATSNIFNKTPQLGTIALPDLAAQLPMPPQPLTAALCLCSFSATLGVSSAAQSQPTSSTAADLRVPARVDIDLSTPKNGDRRSYGQVGAFFPIFQTAGRYLTYLNTIGRVDTSGNLGGSALLGQRLALNEGTLLGGYIAYDIRDTGTNTFSQFGLGAELLSQGWTAHLNGYIPIGQTSAQVGERSSQNQIIDAQFESNQLLLTTGGTQVFESALSRVEAGASFQLGDFGQYGRLWGSGSAYYIEDALGGSLQLDHQVGDRLRVSLGTQSDAIFGTKVFASIGTSLGRSRRSSKTAREAPRNNRAWPNIAGASANRNNSIVVRQEVRGTERESQVAINPQTGQAYRFRHVAPDVTVANQGDGSAERPFTTLGTSRTDTSNTSLQNVEAGEVVYVQADGSPESALAPFVVPGGVSVYSDAIATVISTQMGEVSLPGSGTGIRPLIKASSGDGVVLTGGSNRVSGFEISGATNGVTIANPTGNIIVENNIIDNATNRAVSLIQSADTANINIVNNIINTATNDGIRVELSDTANLTLMINNNAINNITSPDGDGIDIEANGNSRVAIALNNNQIDRAGNSGIELETCGNTTTAACDASFTATIRGNTISNSGGDGILFFHNSNQSAQLDISNNQVRQSGIAQTGITQNVGNPLPATGNGGFGIAAATFADGNLSLQIENNIVENSQDEKIAVINNLQNNVASGTTAAAPAVDATLRGNTLLGTGEGAIAPADVLIISGSQPSAPGTPSLCLALQGNDAANGYFLANGLETAPPTAQTIVTPSTFEQAVGNSADGLVSNGTIIFQSAPLNALGAVTVSSAGSTTDDCSIP